MTKENESSNPNTNINLNKKLQNPETQIPTTSTATDTFSNSNNRNPNKRPRQQSSEMHLSPPNDPKSIKKNDTMEFTRHITYPPYTFTWKNPQHKEIFTDRKLMEHLIQEWKNKNGTEPDITGRFGHEKCLLIFANDEKTFEEMYDKQSWPDNIAENEFEVKAPRILPAAYSLVIQQFFNSWDLKEVLEELKTIYPSLINLTRMKSYNNQPLNLVRADFSSLKQTRKLIDDGRITIGHMKNTVKQYHPPAKLSKCMKCFSHHHNTKECTSMVQLCIRCGIDHPFNNNCQNEIKCVNCGQDHYAGHSACPEVQRIRKQISQNEKIKRTQLLINQEQEQHIHFEYNNQTFPPLPSTPIQQQQEPNQDRYHTQQRTYVAAVQSKQQQTSYKINQNSSHIENMLSACTNRIEHRLQQLEERLINQFIELDKRIDNLKCTTDELETIIYETVLPAIKSMQRYSLNNTHNTRNTTTRDELTKYNNDITTLLMKRNNNNNNSNNDTSIEDGITTNSRTTRSSINKSKSTTSKQVNDSE